MKTEMLLFDKEWRMSNLYKIKDKEGNLITFKPNKPQAEFIRTSHYRNIILKSRQLGMSTFKCIDALDNALFTTDRLFDGIIIAHTKNDAIKLFNQKIKLAWDNLDPTVKALFKVKTDTANEMKFDLGGGHINAVSVGVSARSGTYSYGHITELSYVDKKEPDKSIEIISGLSPAITSGGQMDIESTARGDAGLFHDMFMEAWKNRGRRLMPEEFKPHFFNWQWDEYELAKVTDEEIEIAKEQMPPEMVEYKKRHELDDREIAFYYKKWASQGRSWQLMHTEYPTTVEEAFSVGDEPFFDFDAVHRSPEIHGRVENDWIFYRSPLRNRAYAVGVDVAEGIGRDSSTICVVDMTPMFRNDGLCEVVAEFESNKINATDLAYQVKYASNLYNGAIMGVESNNHGHATLAKLREIAPHRLIYKEQQLNKEINKATDRFGWRTTSSTKPMMLYELKDAINEGAIVLNSSNIKSELKTYPKEQTNKTRGKPGQTNHWDRVIALAIAWQMRSHVKKPRDRKKIVQTGYKRVYT